jgi:hypothetical protein
VGWLLATKDTLIKGGRGPLGSKKQLLIDLPTSSKISLFEHFQQIKKMVSQSGVSGLGRSWRPRK